MKIQRTARIASTFNFQTNSELNSFITLSMNLKFTMVRVQFQCNVKAPSINYRAYSDMDMGWVHPWVGSKILGKWWVGFGNTVTYKMWPDNSNFRLAGKNMHKSFPFCLKLPGVSFASRLVQLSQNEIFQQLDTQ